MTPAKSYLREHYSLRNRIITSVSHCFDNCTYTVRHGLIKGMKRKGGLGFLPAFLTGAAEETPEVRFLSQLDVDDKVVFDIGAYQGILTLFFSRQARQVVAYEPSPRNFQRLMENLRLNKVTNVIARNLALAAESRELTLLYDEQMLGGASADPGLSKQIRQSSRKIGTAVAAAVRLDEDIERAILPAPQFVKLDIEGMEFAALQGMESTLSLHHPAIFMEIHGATEKEKEENVARILAWLSQKGYQRIMHVESGQPATPGNVPQVSSGHLYCTPEA